MSDDHISEAFEKWYAKAGDRQRLKDAFKAGWIACGQAVYSQVSEMDLESTAIGQGEYPFEEL